MQISMRASATHYKQPKQAYHHDASVVAFPCKVLAARQHLRQLPASATKVADLDASPFDQHVSTAQIPMNDALPVQV